jgi:2-(1,2-epoxy-1,2-dihydrophenyl)acetyl-CoA isomerase
MMTIAIDSRLFSAEQIDGIAVIRFKGGLVRQLTDLNLKEGMFRYLHSIRSDKSVKAVLLMGSPGKIKAREMIEFLCEMADPRTNTYEVTRVFNAINQLILFIRGMDKLVIHADSGQVLSLFLNISLACDYRIISDQTMFQYPTLELGLVPKGGGIYFMARTLGPAKTLEIMVAGRDISAAEALSLGIVDRVVPQEAIEAEALAMARKIAQKPSSLVAGIKRLLVASSGELTDFLEKENGLLLDRFREEDFQRCIDACASLRQ